MARCASWLADRNHAGGRCAAWAARRHGRLGRARSGGPDRPRTGEITGIDADLHDVGELTPVLTALAALASSPSHLHGIAHLRGHETDRLAALAEEINHLGGRVTQTEDGLSIRPVPLHGGLVHSHDDHRIATAAAVLGLRIPGLHLDDVATTAKTMPTFVEAWTAMLAH